MEYKKEKAFGRMELADYLERLAIQLREGKVKASGREWTIPDTLRAKVEFQEKRGRFTTKLKWRWATLDEYDAPRRDEVTRWEKSFKGIKKQLGSAFKRLENTARRGQLPDAGSLENFVKLSRAFADMAETDWQDAMEEYMDHMANLERAVENQEPELMVHELRDLKNRMRACHREFK